MRMLARPCEPLPSDRRVRALREGIIVIDLRPACRALQLPRRRRPPQLAPALCTTKRPPPGARF